ncbi:MAG: protein tyrosine phosphatase [Microbacterium sp.]|jgi:protein-tyrosine phosphatase|nr:protein tyrosine phosphatase [Microbacterium sp.]
MIEIATICTGNICRSPLAALMLQTRLAGRGVRVTSAGTRGLADHGMTPEAQRLALARGISASDAEAHRARFLTEQHLVSADLVLAMAREHRRAVAELVPARTRVAFTVREFARLASSLSDAALQGAVATAADQDAAGRLRAAVAAVAGQRGLVLPPADPTDDDVVDPYRRSWSTYETSAAQLDPAIDQVVRVVAVATTT